MGEAPEEKLAKAAMGVAHGGYDLLKRLDPKYFAAFTNLYAEATFDREDAALPRATKELIMVALCTATGRHLGTRIHTRRALLAGARPREVLEALQTAAIPCGMPVLWSGLEVLAETLQEMGRAFE